MPIDILLFAIVAAFLIHRLNAALGTKHGDERERHNPFVPAAQQARPLVLQQPARTAAAVQPAALVAEEILHEAPQKDSPLYQGLMDISKADPYFNLHEFKDGAAAAFEMIVEAFAAGDREALKGFLSENLFFGFFSRSISAREHSGHIQFTDIDRVKDVKITDARLGGVMAYITVQFQADETSYVKDKEGRLLDGDPEEIHEIVDIWTFARDIRSEDPNWLLIETSTPEV